MSKWRNDFALVSRYLSAGALNTIVGIATILLLMSLGISPFLANVAGYALGLLLGFIVSKKFVFRVGGQTQRQSIRYLVAFALSYGANVLTLYWVINSFNLNQQLAQLVAAGVYTASMFILSRWFVFLKPTH